MTTAPIKNWPMAAGLDRLRRTGDSSAAITLHGCDPAAWLASGADAKTLVETLLETRVETPQQVLDLLHEHPG